MAAIETEQNDVQVKPLLRAKLSEEQVRQALVEYLLKNDEVKAAIGDKSVLVVPSWQTSKWSDPNAFVYLEIAEAIDDLPVTPEDATEESDDS